MAGGQRTILILEDDADQVRILRMHLENDGHRVLTCQQSGEFFETIEKSVPDLVLLDVMLDRFDEGFDVCHQLKQHPQTQDVPVIMLTARIEIADRVRGLETGADDYMLKPVDLDELSARVHAALRIRARHESLLELAMMDELTGLYNRRHFENRIRREIESVHRRYHNLLSCLMVDVDHFKQVNDTYGHPVGDRVLQELAKILTQQTRVVDIIARYGGEEFVILLPQTGAKGAHILAERICHSVEQHPFCAPDNLSVTVSIGCSSYQEAKLATAEQLVKAADEALYEAKRTRNSVARYVVR